MEENKFKNLVIALCFIIILLLSAVVVWLLLDKQKPTKPISNGPTTSAPVGQPEEFKYNEEYTKILRNIVKVSETDIEKKYGLEHQLYVIDVDDAYINIEVRYIFNGGDFMKSLKFKSLAGVYLDDYIDKKIDASIVEKLIKEDKDAIAYVVKNGLIFEQFKDIKTDKKYYLVGTANSYQTEGYDFGIYGPTYDLVQTLDVNTGTGFNFADRVKPYLNNTYYEITDNKVYYFAELDCKNRPEEVDEKVAYVEDGKVKIEKYKTFNITKDGIEVVGQSC